MAIKMFHLQPTGEDEFGDCLVFQQSDESLKNNLAYQDSIEAGWKVVGEYELVLIAGDPVMLPEGISE